MVWPSSNNTIWY